ncbi:hypothetical protein D6D01_10016 [Aureobasidium pullulans]|uniref:Uncharacterized protein n=1 Tax=Aureobasidium pullulans TaxID=5580 RepID=A0A4S9JT90_AURPU|nr:hypothetical protein D6D01_10016 [Aureobasidium pullulans]
MFGLLIAGRPIDAAPQVISQTQYAFQVPSRPAFNHIAVFSLPGQELPPDAAAAIFIQIQPSTEFKLVGALSSLRPSTMFKINTGNNVAPGAGEDDLMLDESPEGVEVGGPAVVVGIEIQPAAQVKALLAEQKANSSTQLVRSNQSATASPVTTKVLAQRIIANAFNFLASFGSDTVPLKAFEAWWSKFESKVNNDPSFLERPQD